MFRLKNILLKKYIAALSLGAAMLFFTQCGTNVDDQTISVDRSKWPTVKSKNKLIVVSDSGMVKFRVYAPVQEIYDDVKGSEGRKAYWEFPEGILMERFGPGMRKIAEIKSEYAHYAVDKEIWTWKNKVVATNSENDIFETEILFWDQKKELVYSEEFIKITMKEGYQTGYGFESNQDFTRYTIKESQAEFPFMMN